MPYSGNQHRREAVAVRTIVHGAPCIVDNFPGIASKAQQLTRYVDPNTAAARTIAVGERFVQQLGTEAEVIGANIDGGVAAATLGTLLYIIPTTDRLTTTATGNVAFGRVTEVRTDRVRVNLNVRV